MTRNTNTNKDDTDLFLRWRRVLRLADLLLLPGVRLVLHVLRAELARWGHVAGVVGGEEGRRVVGVLRQSRVVLVGVRGGGGGRAGGQVVLLLLHKVAAAAGRRRVTWVTWLARWVLLVGVLLPRVLPRVGRWVTPVVQGGAPHVVEGGVEVRHHLRVGRHSG